MFCRNTEWAGIDWLFCSWNQNQSHRLGTNVPLLTFLMSRPPCENSVAGAVTKNNIPLVSRPCSFLFSSQGQWRCYIVNKESEVMLVQTEPNTESHFSWLIPGMKDVAGISLHLTAEGSWRMKHGGQYLNKIFLVLQQNVKCQFLIWNDHESSCICTDLHLARFTNT